MIQEAVDGLRGEITPTLGGIKESLVRLADTLDDIHELRDGMERMSLDENEGQEHKGNEPQAQQNEVEKVGEGNVVVKKPLQDESGQVNQEPAVQQPGHSNGGRVNQEPAVQQPDHSKGGRGGRGRGRGEFRGRAGAAHAHFFYQQRQYHRRPEGHHRHFGNRCRCFVCQPGRGGHRFRPYGGAR